METKSKMGTMAMPRLILNMSLPLMISLLVQSLYNIVDSVFVARIGEDALTATSLAFPIQLLMIAVAVGTSVGINALLSKGIGAKDYAAAENVAATGVILACIGMLVFSVLAGLWDCLRRILPSEGSAGSICSCAWSSAGEPLSVLCIKDFCNRWEILLTVC